MAADTFAVTPQQLAAMPAPTKRRLDAVLCSYRVYRKTYEYDPEAWLHDIVKWPAGKSPTPYQIETVNNLVQYKREAVRGPHGLGKTAMAALVIHWFASTRDGDDWKLPTTASAWRQLTHYLWPEVHKWAMFLNWAKIGRPAYLEGRELLDLSLKLDTGHAFAVASDQPALIEGAHADRLLYLFDESKTIPDKTFDAAEGAFSGAGGGTGHEGYALAISTPGPPHGRFYDIHSRRPGYEDWHVRHVKIDEAIAAGRIAVEWVEQRRKQWGADSALFKNRVLGEFAEQEADGVVPLEWVEQAVERWKLWRDGQTPETLAKLQYKAVGVDVAREGSDRSVYAPRVDKTIVELRERPRQDTMTTTGEVAGILRAHGGIAIVDVIGIGAGVVDRLRELLQQKRLGLGKVIAFNASAKAEGRTGRPLTDQSGELEFVNMRSASWWNVRELLDPANENNVLLPDDDMLRGDLVAPKWETRSGGKIYVEAKEDVKARIGRSTDHGDAVVQAFALELLPSTGVKGAPVGVAKKSTWRGR